MAGASTTAPKSSFEISKEDAPSSSEFEQIKKDIYKRTKERNPELENFKEAETAYLKWLASLQETFQPTFFYRNLLGLELGKDKKTTTYIKDKDQFVDFAYLAFTRMPEPKKAEDGTHTFRTDDGAITAKSGKIEFVAGFEPAEEGKKPKKKEFSLEDAYNVVLLAMQDRTMMPPNKMKFHGTKKERAMLWHAAQKINAELPKTQRFNVGAQPQSIIPFAPLFSKKDDPFNRIFMDVRNNVTDPNAWSIREKEAAQEAEEAKKAAPATTDKDNNNPDGGGPTSTPPNDKNGGPSPSDGAEDTLEPAGATGEEQELSPEKTPDPKAIDLAASATQPQEAEILAPPIATTKLANALGQVHARLRPVETIAAQEEHIDPVEKPSVAERQNDSAEENSLDQLEKVYTNVRNYIVQHEDALRGRSAFYEIKSLLDIMPSGNLATHENMNSFAKVMEAEGIIVRDKTTGEPLLRGLAQFTPRDPDYNDFALTFVRGGNSHIGLTQERFTSGIENLIGKDSIHETKGFGHKLSPLLRKDIAHGMAQRILTHLQEDNVIQMKDGKISYIASGFSGNMNLQQNFEKAATTTTARQAPQPAAQAQPVQQAQQPVAQQQAKAKVEQQPQSPAPEPAVAPAPVQRVDKKPQGAQATTQKADIDYDKAVIANIEGTEPNVAHEQQESISQAKAAPELSSLDILRQRLNITSAYQQPIKEEHVPIIDKVLGEPDFEAHADGISEELADDIAASIAKTLGPITEGAHKPSPEELGFRSIKADVSLSSEEFPAATFNPPIAETPQRDDTAELERLTRDLSQLIVDNETQTGAVITDDMKRNNPLPSVWDQPKVAAQ